MQDPREIDNPLTPDEIARLRRGRACCNRADLLINKMQQCGINCQAEQAVSDALKQRMDAMLHHFGGERKSR